MTHRERVLSLVESYFGDDVSELHTLPLLQELYLTQARGHVYALAQLAGLDPDLTDLEPLFAAYCYLACHYVLVDSTLDGQTDVVSSLLPISEAISLFLVVAEAEVCDRLPAETRLAVRRRMLRRLVQRDQALRSELDSRRGWQPLASDYEEAVGRSSLTILLYELLCAHNQREPNAQALEALCQYIYAMQMSDDLVDWRKDLARDNHTPFLRRCAARIRSEHPTDEEMERAIYLDGYFEDMATELALTFEAIQADFRKVGGEYLALYAAQSYDRVRDELATVVDTKAKYLRTLAGRPTD